MFIIKRNMLIIILLARTHKKKSLLEDIFKAFIDITYYLDKKSSRKFKKSPKKLLENLEKNIKNNKLPLNLFINKKEK